MSIRKENRFSGQSKKLVLLLFTAVLMLIAVSSAASCAQVYAASSEHGEIVAGGTENDKMGDSAYWTLYEDGALVVTGSGEIYDYSSGPSNPLYNYNTTIKTVAINSGITKIGSYAFESLTNCTDISLPDSVTAIKDQAFSNCWSLKSFYIPKSLSSLATSAFNNCDSLVNFTVSDENTTFSQKMGILFAEDGTKLVRYPPKCIFPKYEIPNTVTEISGYAFNDCNLLEEISIPASVASIGSSSFRNCSNLKAVSFLSPSDSKLQTIGNHTFAGCSKLEKLELPSSVQSIGSYAFSHCFGLSSFDPPSSLKTIGDYAFAHCRSFTSMDFSSVELNEIGSSVFYSCEALTSVIFPRGIATVHDNVFRNCSKLEVVDFPDSVTQINDSNETSSLSSISSLQKIIIRNAACTPYFLKDMDPESAPAIYGYKGDILEYAVAAYNLDFFDLNDIEITPEVTLAADSFEYDGTEKVPEVSVSADGKVLDPQYYTVSGNKNTVPGIYTVRVKLCNGYAGQGTAKYTIHLKATPEITLSQTQFEYDGTAKAPKITSVTAGGLTVDSSHYTASIGSGTETGNYTVTVTLKDGFEGEASAEYSIVPAGSAIVSLTPAVFTYDGAAHSPDVEISYGGNILDASEYTVTGLGAINAGQYEVTVTLSSDTSVTASAFYNIKPCAATPDLTLSQASFEYNGEVQFPDVTVKVGDTVLTESDYEVVGDRYKDPGEYSLSVNLKGNYTGSASAGYSIIESGSDDAPAQEIIKATPVIKLSASKFYYDGKTKTPKVEVYVGGKKLASSYYNAAIKKGKLPGKYKVSVTLKGKYSGSAKKYYRIVIKEPVITRISHPSKGKFIVRWKANKKKNLDGYQIQACTNKKFKITSKKTGKDWAVSVKAKYSGLKNCSSNTTYYVRVRSYKVIKVRNSKGKLTKKKYYSSWSKVKKIKVK